MYWLQYFLSYTILSALQIHSVSLDSLGDCMYLYLWLICLCLFSVSLVNSCLSFLLHFPSKFFLEILHWINFCQTMPFFRYPLLSFWNSIIIILNILMWIFNASFWTVRSMELRLFILSLSPPLFLSPSLSLFWIKNVTLLPN